MIKDKYPNLHDQLNDLTAKVPAYHHFESLGILRDDLRETKDRHFVKNYSNELTRDKKDFEKQYFGVVKQPDYLAQLRARFQSAFVKKKG